MNGNKVKKWAVLCLVAGVFTVWVCVKYIFPQTGIRIPQPVEEQNGDRAYYKEIFHPAGGMDFSDRDDRSGTILQIYHRVSGAGVSKEIAEEAVNSVNTAVVQVAGGAVVNDYSVVTVTVALRNDRSRAAFMTPNTMYLRIYEGDRFVRFEEPFYMTPYTYGPSDAKHFHVTLQPGAEITLQLSYCVRDLYLEEPYRMELELNPSGVDRDTLPGPEDHVEDFIIGVDLKKLLKEQEGTEG